MICKRVIYTGRVQGVGFRYTAQRLASGLPVAGYVRNLSDGSVELVAQGEPEAVESLLARIARHMTGYVAGVRVTEQTPAEFDGFEIRH